MPLHTCPDDTGLRKLDLRDLRLYKASPRSAGLFIDSDTVVHPGDDGIEHFEKGHTLKAEVVEAIAGG